MTITLPIYWSQTKTKTVLCSMNAYRNWHYHTSSKWKQDFHNIIKQQLSDDLPTFTKYRLSINLYYKNAACDGANVAALMEKVSLDALQEVGVLVQDNVKHHLGTTWNIGGQDRDNPRCHITITSV